MYSYRTLQHKMASYFLLLFVALYALFVSAYAQLNIDCGSGENLVLWSGDESYMKNGSPKTVQSRYSISEVMDTLRVFTKIKKNCYDIPVTGGGRVLVRASFLYGNYDGKSSPPTFDLQFAGNEWVTVETSMDQLVQHELIYTMKGEYTSVCVTRTHPNQFPFISAVEVRSLNSYMYNYMDANYAYYLQKRVAYGANNVMGNDDDLYGRLWSPENGGNGVINVTNDALFIITDKADYPPKSALMNAATPSDDTSSSLKLVTDFPSDEVIIYMNLYFSEVTELDASENRSFILHKDEEAFADTIVPPFGGFYEYVVYNLNVSSNTALSLVAAPGSTIPPIINAMEIFFISDVLTDGTNSNDVEGLVLLQNTFPVLTSWGGDPCLPAPYSWEWINCSSDPIPRVTELHLRSFNLSGELPDFSSMDALQIIDLEDNSLNGEIPDFLGELPKLKQLNLANNQFSGSIPSSLSKKSDLLDVKDNPDLCTSDSCPITDSTTDSATDSPFSPDSPSSTGTSFSKGKKNKKKKSNKLSVALGTSIPSFFLVWVIVAVFAVIPYYRKRAAVATANPGHGESTTPHGTASNSHIPGKVNTTFVNEIIDDINDQVEVELAEDIQNEHTPIP